MLLRAAPSLPCVSVLSPSRLAPLVACPFTPPIEGERRDAVQVLTFHTKAWSSFAPPTCRMPPGQSSGHPPSLSREKGPPPVSTSSDLLRHVIDGLLSLASPDLTSRDIVPTFPATLTTIALNDSSLRWFEAYT